MHIDQAALSGNKNSHHQEASRSDRSPVVGGELGASTPPAQCTDVMLGSGTLPDSEFLLSSIRSATLRARLVANELDAVGMSLKRNLISVEGAVAWLRSENLLDHVLFRPELLNGSNAA